MAGRDVHVTADGRNPVVEVREPVAACVSSTSNPTPSSCISNATRPACAWTLTVTVAPVPACLAAFWIASRQQK
jgi:hypothetical protein